MFALFEVSQPEKISLQPAGHHKEPGLKDPFAVFLKNLRPDYQVGKSGFIFVGMDGILLDVPGCCRTVISPHTFTNMSFFIVLNPEMGVTSGRSGMDTVLTAIRDLEEKVRRITK